MHRLAAFGMIAGILVPAFFHVCVGFGISVTVILSLLIFAAWIAFRDMWERKIWLLTGVVFFLMVVRLSVSTEAPSWEVPEVFISARRRVSTQLTLLLPEPHAAFMAGLLTGERSDLPKEVLEDMRRTGLTHILAISGFNITLVLVFLEKACFFIPRKLRLLPLAGGVILFTLFTGASASVVRACIMGILQLLALHVGRPSDMRLLIGWTLAGMVLFDPVDLRDDLGMHLSFLAVLGLTEFSPLLLSWGKRFPETLGIREALLTTIAAQLTAGPYSAYQFGTLPLHSPILNIFVAPLLPLAMLSGALALVASLVSTVLGQVLILPGWLALTFILWIGHLGSTMNVMIIGGLQGSRLLLLGWGLLLWCVYRSMRPLIETQDQPG